MKQLTREDAIANLQKESEELRNEIKCLTTLLRHSKKKRARTLHLVRKMNHNEYYSECEYCLKHCCVYLKDRSILWITLNHLHGMITNMDYRVKILTCDNPKPVETNA